MCLGILRIVVWLGLGGGTHVQLRAGQLWKRAPASSPDLLEDKPPAVALDPASIWSRWPALKRAQSFPAKHFCSMSKTKKTGEASLGYYVPRLWNKSPEDQTVSASIKCVCLVFFFVVLNKHTHTHFSLNIWTVRIFILPVKACHPYCFSVAPHLNNDM